MSDRVQWDPIVGHPDVVLRPAGPCAIDDDGRRGVVRYVTYGLLRGTTIVVHPGDYLERTEPGKGHGGTCWRVIPRAKVEAAS